MHLAPSLNAIVSVSVELVVSLRACTGNERSRVPLRMPKYGIMMCSGAKILLAVFARGTAQGFCVPW